MTIKNYNYYLFLLLIGSSLLYGKNEIAKDSCEDNPLNSIDLILRVGLYNSNQNPGQSGVNSLDGTILQFSDGFSNCNNALDSDKIFGPDENIYTSVDGDVISIQSRRTPSSNFNEIIDLFFFNLTQPQYKLYFEFISDPGLDRFVNGLFLWDKCENTFTSVSDLEVINFDLTCTASNPFNGERFALVFKENPLINDNSFNALELPVDQASAGDEFTTVGGTAENNEPAAGLNDGINGSVWFSFLAPVAGNVKITTDIAGGTADDTEIAVYSYDGSCSADFTNFNRIGYDDNSGSLVPNSSTLYLENLTEGERYFIQVDGTSSSTPGTFGVEIRTFTVFTYSTSENYLPFDPNGQSLSESVLIIQDGTAVIDRVTSLRKVVVKPAGILDLNANLNSNIVFESSASGSGQLEEISGSTINGEVTVERYIPAKRAYRFLSSPVTTTDFIFENWQESGSTPASSDGLGTHITGGLAIDGFDQSGTNNPSLFTFDNAFLADQPGENQSDAWMALPNTNAKKLRVGEPYLTFVRGDRSIDLSINSAAANPTTLSAKGDLHIGSITYDVSTPVNYLKLSTVNDFYNLVANPYQAVVDYSAVTRSGLTDFIYVWDASVSSAGGYVTVDITGNTTPPNPFSSDASKFIAPGQSFFVQNDNAPGDASITFEEADKATSASEVSVFDNYPHFYINSRLYKTSDLQNSGSESDALGLRFSDNYTTLGNNNEDATKLDNPGETYAVINNGLRSIDHQQIPALGHEIDFSITNYTETNYSLSFVMQNKPGGLGVFLSDAYLNTQTELTESFVYDFTVDANIPGSIAEDRFSLIFDNTTLGIDDNSFGANFSLYPNPTKGNFMIKTTDLSGEVNVAVHNLLGQEVLSKRLKVETNGEVNIDASKLTSGIYMVKLMQEKQSRTFKVIIE